MMEAVSPTETSVNIYQTTWCYSLEDSHLQVNLFYPFVKALGSLLDVVINVSCIQRAA
jgi:hypothetical protein